MWLKRRKSRHQQQVNHAVDIARGSDAQIGWCLGLSMVDVCSVCCIAGVPRLCLHVRRTWLVVSSSMLAWSWNAGSSICSLVKALVKSLALVRLSLVKFAMLWCVQAM